MIDEVQQLRMQLADHGEKITRLETEIERLTVLKTPASRALLNIRMLDLNAEIKQLRAIIQDLLWDIGHDNDLREVTTRAKAILVKDAKS